jgi:acetyltransferase
LPTFAENFARIMVNHQLINPKSIVVVGASDNIQKPGGKVLRNLLNGNFQGDLYVSHPKEEEIQGIKSYRKPADLPEVELAIIAIAAKYTYDVVKLLTEQKKTKAFIILSAGYSEESQEGKELEDKIVKQINKHGASLIGPNCIGVLTPHYNGVFTLPIPKLKTDGVDFISGSGATACFIMEAGIPLGLTFANVFSVGNSAQIGVEEVLEYMDMSFDPATSSKVKMLYIENIDKPQKLLKHASSLIRKGCKIVAVKAGTSEAGSRAASSHTGALASPDVAVDALFRKAGIVRAYGREELIYIAAVFMYPKLQGKNIAVITHAGGPAVMLTDALEAGGLKVPPIAGAKAQQLKEKLFPGSSVANPIDFLATGTAEQLGIIIDAVNQDFDNIDAMVVIFGTPGLFPIFDVYDLLRKKMADSQKPIYPVLPSILTAHEEVESFIRHGGINFPDEVQLGKALSKVFFTPKSDIRKTDESGMDENKIRSIINHAKNGYLSPPEVNAVLQAAGISTSREKLVTSVEEAMDFVGEIGFPIVMKVVGPVHKSDVGGISLNINSSTDVEKEFTRIMQIKDAKAVLIQPMLSGIELFAGIKKEGDYGHLLLAGLGGIYIEVLKDFQTALTPVHYDEALAMIKKLNAYEILEGVRGQNGIKINDFIENIVRLSHLVDIAPEIIELDLNPLLGNPEYVIAVDARIRIEH